MAASDHARVECFYEDALAVLRRLQAAGHVAYFAGGCVRDRLLGLEPKDWDVATDAPPDRVREIFPRTTAVGAAFGVILVQQRRSIVEVATFRSDGDYLDGRRPNSVTFSTPESDARRRDFTINGLFYDPIADRVIDFVGGRADLERRILRAIGSADARFAEDYLRVLRAVRFAARFELTIEEKTFRAIVAHAPSLIAISPERVGDELRAMLTPASRDRAHALLLKTHVLPVILRFLGGASAGSPEGSAGVFARVSPGESISYSLALATLAFDWQLAHHQATAVDFLTEAAAKQAGHAFRQALRISNDDLAAVESITNLDMLFQEAEPRVAVMKRFLARPTSGDSRRFLAALSAAGHLRQRIAWLESQFASFEPASIAPTPLINGEDLIRLGITPGPVFKTILDAVYDAQLEDEIKDHAAAVAMAKSLAAGR